jgi:hypothetical protein
MEVGTAIFSWLAIAFCLSQSALFSGLNLAAFGISRLRLEADAASGHAEASILLHLRQDSNFLLTTIIWGNVSVNVLLTLVSKSVMSGVLAFFFSAVVITIFGEIVPQAYFVRHASRVVSRLAPLLRIYQKLLYPVAKPTAMLLDRWLGPEGVQYWREESLERFLRAHAHAEEADDIHAIEGVGAANFLSLDDIPLGEEGEEVDPASIIQLPFEGELPVFPAVVAGDAESALIQSIQSSGKKWVVITDESREPRLVLDSDGFLRAVLFHPKAFLPLSFCHRPILATDAGQPLGSVLGQLRVQPMGPGDDVVDRDIILLWGSQRRVITGADLLGRLLRGIAVVELAQNEEEI